MTSKQALRDAMRLAPILREFADHSTNAVAYALLDLSRDSMKSTQIPVGPSSTDILRNAVSAAVMAPSSHNTQPWRFRIAGTSLDLFTDPDRRLSVIDPESRQQVQSCGCAFFNARVAVRAMGFVDEITVMLVDHEQPGHLATLHLGAMHIASDDDRELMAAIGQRHTNRREFLARPVAAAATDAMAAAAASEGATLVRLEPEQKHRIAHMIDEADRRQFDDPAFRAELTRWLTPFGSRRRDGIPFVEKEYGSGMPFALMRALRSPSLGSEFGQVEEQRVDGAPVVAVIGTAHDAASDWFACGQALQSVLLRATALGLSAAFVNQVLELPDQRARVAELVPEIEYPQMVLRLGFPSEPIRHAAPRRELDDVLDIATDTKI